MKVILAQIDPGMMTVTMEIGIRMPFI